MSQESTLFLTDIGVMPIDEFRFGNKESPPGHKVLNVTRTRDQKGPALFKAKINEQMFRQAIINVRRSHGSGSRELYYKFR